MLYRAVLTIVPNFIVIHETTVAETAWSFYTGHCKGQEPYLNLFNLTNEKERSPVIVGLPSWSGRSNYGLSACRLLYTRFSAGKFSRAKDPTLRSAARS